MVQVVEEVVTLVILRNDRATKFVHLKDHRESGIEQKNVLSGYLESDGFSGYEVNLNAASHFFIGHLPPGVQVFETSLRVQHAGKYKTGIAEVRCIYRRNSLRAERAWRCPPNRSSPELLPIQCYTNTVKPPLQERREGLSSVQFARQGDP